MAREDLTFKGSMGFNSGAPAQQACGDAELAMRHGMHDRTHFHWINGDIQPYVAFDLAEGESETVVTGRERCDCRKPAPDPATEDVACSIWQCRGCRGWITQMMMLDRGVKMPDALADAVKACLR